MDMRQEVKKFMEDHAWEAEAVQELTAFYDQWAADGACLAVLEKWVEEYRHNIHMDYRLANREVEAAAERAGKNAYQALLLLYLCLGRLLPEHYRRAGLPMEVCEDSLEDLKWKARECHKVYGVWGSFVAHWFPGFFDLTRFAIGRMQYELVPFPEKYVQAGGKQPEGAQWAINTHIPSSGRLNHEECVASYKKAASFWKEYFQIETPVFCCDSWLLFPEHEKFLPQQSNILRFQRDYRIYDSHTDEKGGDLWRIFDMEYDGRPEKLPEDTGLRRAYKKWLMDGNLPGWGRGVLKGEALE